MSGDAILGLHVPPTRHAALGAAEAGVDYVAIAPDWPESDDAPELVSWWAEMIETPLVVTNAQTARDTALGNLRGLADFVLYDAGLESASQEDFARFARALGL